MPRGGLLISFLYSAFKDPVEAITAFCKQHNFEHRVHQYSITEGVLQAVGKAGLDLDNLLVSPRFLQDDSVFGEGETLVHMTTASQVSNLTVIAHVIMVASKAVTARATCVATAARRMEAMANSHPIDLRCSLSEEAAEVVAEVLLNDIRASHCGGDHSIGRQC